MCGGCPCVRFCVWYEMRGVSIRASVQPMKISVCWRCVSMLSQTERPYQTGPRQTEGVWVVNADWYVPNCVSVVTKRNIYFELLLLFCSYKAHNYVLPDCWCNISFMDVKNYLTGGWRGVVTWLNRGALVRMPPLGDSTDTLWFIIIVVVMNMRVVLKKHLNRQPIKVLYERLYSHHSPS